MLQTVYLQFSGICVKLISMKLKSIKRNFQKVIIIFGTLILLVPFLPSFPAPKASASDVDDLYERLEELEEELATIRKQKQNLSENIKSEENLQDELSSEIAKLSNNISTLELNIKEKKAKIKKKETEIKILEEEITDARHLIRDIESDMNVLEETTDDILRSIYIDTKTNSTIDIFIKSGDSKSFISELQYHTALGKYDQNALQNLQKEKRILKEQKSKLEDNKLEIEKLAEQIKIEKRSLEKDKEQIALQRGQKHSLLAQSEQNEQSYENTLANLTDEEKRYISEQLRVKQQLFNQIGQLPNGAPVKKGDVIGQQGCTGYCLGPHLHFFTDMKHNGGLTDNPCHYLPGGVVSGCGTSNPTIAWPMKGTFYLTSGYGWRWGRFHDAIDIAYSFSYSPKYIYAAHSGYIQFGKTNGCGGAPICNDGGAKYAIICQYKNNCNKGKKTGYFHLK